MEDDIENRTGAERQPPAPDPQVLWDNRRRMAWLSFFALLGMAAWGMFGAEGLSSSREQLLTGIAWTLGAIVLGYIGFAAWDNVAQRRSHSRLYGRGGGNNW